MTWSGARSRYRQRTAFATSTYTTALSSQPEKEGSEAVLAFAIEAHGFAAVLATRAAPDAKMQDLMAHMKTMTATPLSSYADQWKTLGQQMVAIAPAKAVGAAPEGMVAIPGGDYIFKVQGIEIEGFNDIGVDVQYPWEDMPRRFHEHRMTFRGSTWTSIQ